MSIKITETGAALGGARIEGIDLTKPLDEATSAAVRNAFYKYEVVYFRGIELSDEDHIRFSERFGELRKLVTWVECSTQHRRHSTTHWRCAGACIARLSLTAL